MERQNPHEVPAALQTWQPEADQSSVQAAGTGTVIVGRMQSRSQAAAFLGISLRLLDKLVHEGRLQGVKINKRRVFPPEELQAFVAISPKE
jgi:excisionase family DNA binding protein